MREKERERERRTREKERERERGRVRVKAVKVDGGRERKEGRCAQGGRLWVGWREIHRGAGKG